MFNDIEAGSQVAISNPDGSTFRGKATQRIGEGWVLVAGGSTAIATTDNVTVVFSAEAAQVLAEVDVAVESTNILLRTVSATESDLRRQLEDRKLTLQRAHTVDGHTSPHSHAGTSSHAAASVDLIGLDAPDKEEGGGDASLLPRAAQYGFGVMTLIGALYTFKFGFSLPSYVSTAAFLAMTYHVAGSWWRYDAVGDISSTDAKWLVRNAVALGLIWPLVLLLAALGGQLYILYRAIRSVMGGGLPPV